MNENYRPLEVDNAYEYYGNPEVSRVVWQYLGMGNPGVSLVGISPDNIDSLRNTLGPEYLAVMAPSVKEEKPGRAPARSIKRWNLPYMLERDPKGEVYQSLWHVDAPGSERIPLGEKLPSETLLFWDIEHFHKIFERKAIEDPIAVYDLLEPSYRAITDLLNRYGINHMAVMSGKGYHFVTKVPYNSNAMRSLLEAGNLIEPEVSNAQAMVTLKSKKDRPIPPNVELAFKGAVRLQQYLFTLAIEEARRNSSVNVEVSDFGSVEGISFDNTSMLRHVGSAVFGTLGSLYAKPYVKSGDFPTNSRNPIIRIARGINGNEVLSLRQALATRASFSEAIKHFSSISGEIPDGSNGLYRLFQDYNKSLLRQLHLAVDIERGDPAEKWNDTYRNYDGIINQVPELGNIINSANPIMLQPDSLNFLVNTLFDKWGGKGNIRVAGHVAAFLRSVYEDGRYDWGSKFVRHDIATRHANGWVQIILGQRKDLGPLR